MPVEDGRRHVRYHASENVPMGPVEHAIEVPFLGTRVVRVAMPDISTRSRAVHVVRVIREALLTLDTLGELGPRCPNSASSNMRRPDHRTMG